MTDDNAAFIGERLREAVALELQGTVHVRLETMVEDTETQTFRFCVEQHKGFMASSCLVSVCVKRTILWDRVALAESLDRITQNMARGCVAEFARLLREHFARKVQYN